MIVTEKEVEGKLILTFKQAYVFSDPNSIRVHLSRKRLDT